jgi:hypothetical protein
MQVFATLKIREIDRYAPPFNAVAGALHPNNLFT